MRALICLGLILLSGCAHDRDTSAPPQSQTTVTSAPARPPQPIDNGNYDNGSVPERTWGTGGVSNSNAGPGSGAGASPPDVGVRDAGAVPPNDPRNPSPDYAH